jgi:hypothetical protein
MQKERNPILESTNSHFQTSNSQNMVYSIVAIEGATPKICSFFLHWKIVGGGSKSVHTRTSKDKDLI